MSTSHAADTRQPYVRSFEPSARAYRMFKIGNAVLKPILHSRLGARIRDLALFTFAGRKTGKRYTVPVALYEFDGEPVITTAAPWRFNLRGGADVEVVTRGSTRKMHAELVEDRDEVAEVYAALLEKVGVEHANRVGLKLAGDRMPTRDEVVGGIGNRRAVIRLTPRS